MEPTSLILAGVQLTRLAMEAIELAQAGSLEEANKKLQAIRDRVTAHDAEWQKALDEARAKAGGGSG